MNRKYKQRIRQQYRDNIFMKELSSELRNQPNDHNAAPVFWGIQDYKDVVTHDDFGEFIKVVDHEEGREFCEKDFIEYVKEEFDLDESGNIDDMDIHELVDYIELMYLDCSLSIYSFIKVPYIKEDAMFLTKNEATNHLKNNRKHYTSEAHTYAMTAWRAPKVERLLKILAKK